MSTLKIVRITISGLLCLSLIACYLIKPDSFAAVTFLPPWVWLILGGLLLIEKPKRRLNRYACIVALLWVVFLIEFAEEPRSVFRRPSMTPTQVDAARRMGKVVRVVTLNCAGGSYAAASEAEKYSPDIVLLQESPGRKDVEKLTRKLCGKHGHYICGIDTAVIVRGTIIEHEHSKELSMISVSGTARLNNGPELNIISLRLVPPVFRLDLWSPDCWREQTSNRRARLQQIKIIAKSIDDIPATSPLIVGGDFNAPAGDVVYRYLKPYLHDSFVERGIGWGNTVLNDSPVQRVDQIWVSKQMKTVSTRAFETAYSDHRMVVCNVEMM